MKNTTRWNCIVTQRTRCKCGSDVNTHLMTEPWFTHIFLSEAVHRRSALTTGCIGNIREHSRGCVFIHAYKELSTRRKQDRLYFIVQNPLEDKGHLKWTLLHDPSTTHPHQKHTQKTKNTQSFYTVASRAKESRVCSSFFFLLLASELLLWQQQMCWYGHLRLMVGRTIPKHHSTANM